MITRRPVAGPADRRDDDSGQTLLELVVALSILGIFLSIFTGAILTIYHSASKAQNTAITSEQINQAVTNLDSAVRYASAISAPSVGTDGNTYVAWESSYTGTTTCTQLRLDVSLDQLQQRTWTPVDGAATSLTSWLPIASDTATPDWTDPATGSTAVPFTVTGASPTVPYEQLQVQLAATIADGDGTNTTSRTNVTFTAFNTTLTTPTAGICQEAGTS